MGRKETERPLERDEAGPRSDARAEVEEEDNRVEEGGGGAPRRAARWVDGVERLTGRATLRTKGGLEIRPSGLAGLPKLDAALFPRFLVADLP